MNVWDKKEKFVNLDEVKNIRYLKLMGKKRYKSWEKAVT